MQGGTFSLVYQYTLYTSPVTRKVLLEDFCAVTYADPVNDEYVRLQAGVDIPYGSNVISLTLVYRGKLGDEDDAVVGRVIPLTSRIAYSGQVGCGNNQSHIYTIGQSGPDDAKMTDDVKITNDSDGYSWRVWPAWSADGKTLAFNGITSENHYDIVVIDLTSEEVYPNNIKTVFHDSSAHFIHPSFGPDGTKIMAERMLTEHPDATDALDSIVIFDVNSGSFEFLADVEVWRENDPNAEPTWSPKGDRVIFDHDNSLDTQWQTQSIWSIGYPGTSEQPTELTDKQYYCWRPAWSPNGEEIVYASKQDGGQIFDMWVMGKAGSSQRLLHSSS